MIKATDMYTIVECDRKVFLDVHGDPDVELPPSSYEQFIFQQGRQFEKSVVAEFRFDKPEHKVADLESGFRLTLEMMRRGVPMIYQGVLLHDDMAGIPDFLQRVDGRSRFGNYHYRPIDVKSSRETKLAYSLQVMFYSHLLEAIQDVRPGGSLYLKNKEGEELLDESIYHEEPIEFDADRLGGYLAEIRKLKAGYEPEPFISARCRSCPWREICIPMAEQSRDVSLVSGLRRNVWSALHQMGQGTLDAVALLEPSQLVDIKGVGDKTAANIVNHARALAQNRVLQLSVPDMPPPAETEIYFDIESIPSENLIYLMGLLVCTDQGVSFEYDLARSPEDEQQMWEDFLARMDRLPGPVYHYGYYEKTTIRALMERYGEDRRALALIERMVNLERVLKASVVLPLQSYSLKTVAPWLGYEWTGETQAADDSMLEYYHWLEDGDEQHLRHILHYNEDDVRATKVIKEWLSDNYSD